MKPRLVDEIASNQEQQCAEFDASYFCEDDDNEPAFGADPFDILAHKQEQGELQ